MCACLLKKGGGFECPLFNEQSYNIHFVCFCLILGATALSLAYGSHQMGIIPYIILLAIFGVAAEFSIMLLVECMNLTGHKTFAGIGKQAAGVKGELTAVVA